MIKVKCLKIFHNQTNCIKLNSIGETSLCWAYSIATMIRHTLSKFVNDLKPKFPVHDFSDALDYLGNKQFHKRIRDEIIMIPIPKLRIQKKCPVGMKQRDFNDWVIEEQRHILNSPGTVIFSLFILRCYFAQIEESDKRYQKYKYFL